MDFIAPNMPSAPSGPPVDGSPKPVRATTSQNSSSVRKSFSTVLQRARGEGERGDAREADDSRPATKSDAGSPSKETRGLSGSSTRTERADTSPAQATDDSRSSDNESNTEVSKTDVESSGQESSAGSDSQGQESAPVVAVIPFQPAPEAIDETEAHTEGESHLEDKVEVGEEIHSSQKDTEASGDLPKSPLISVATVNAPVTESHPSEDHPSPNTVSTPPHDLARQELDASSTQVKNASQADQAVRQTPYVVADDSGAGATDSGKTQPVSVEPQPTSTLPHQDSVVRRAFHAYLGAVSSNGKPETPKPDSVQPEAVPQDHSVSTQVNCYGRALGNPEDIGARARWAFPHGQQPGAEAGEQSNELWADHNGPQPDHVVAKLPQAAVVELQLANGQSAGPMAAGVQAHSGSGPTPPPSTASFVSPPPPALPAHDTMEHSARLMTRSVVLDLAQPDLGHVNVRVAMMNDVVHTHMSADRPEVGQYLMNGQDRLQAVLQTNGLEMGQFRVDIDRQGTGRSFQQGSFQEQGYAWNQGSHGMEHEHGHDRRDEPRGSLHGLLNLVA